MRGPCKDCDRRTVTCHGQCADYQAYRDRIDEAKRMNAIEEEAESYLKAKGKRMKDHSALFKRQLHKR